jgi:hypothetical protein
VGIDLVGIDLVGIDLVGIDLVGIDLVGMGRIVTLPTGVPGPTRTAEPVCMARRRARIRSLRSGMPG